MFFYFYLFSSLSALEGMRGETKHADAFPFITALFILSFIIHNSFRSITTVAWQTDKSYAYYNLALDYWHKTCIALVSFVFAVFIGAKTVYLASP